MTNSTSPVVHLSNIHKDFQTDGNSVSVLRGLSLEVGSGERIAIIGPSGSGKSTLLHIIGTLDRPTAGEIKIQGRDPTSLAEPELARFRNKVVGFVFQEHHLLPQYSVLENVLIPTMATKQDEDAVRRAHELLERVGLGERLQHRPAQLSGGERQRVAIARALINKPAILLCDEPTGDLDHKTALSIANLFFELQEQEKNVLITVTHSLELAARFQRQLQLREGVWAEA
jgi:lipoprotein-releasing system ATP-binding protein